MNREGSSATQLIMVIAILTYIAQTVLDLLAVSSCINDNVLM